MLGLLARRADEQSSNEAMDKTWRAVISGAACLTPYLAFLAEVSKRKQKMLKKKQSE
jgi:hypothetical protein